MVWRVLNSSRYSVYQPVPADNGEMRAAVLLRVDEDGTPTATSEWPWEARPSG